MQWRSNKLTQNGGFTLLEVLISMFILSIVVTSASVAFVYSTKQSNNNELRMNALNIANETVEYIRALPFSEVGTKYVRPDGVVISGDPPGEILQEETKQLNGVDYLVKVSINWEEEADWDLSGTAEWDYKSVYVSVTPQGSSDYHNLEQTIETYFTRDFSQPALPGSNIRIRSVKGWKLPGDSTQVIQGVNVLLASGPSAVRFVNTSSKGIASFINLVPGNYTVEIDPTSAGFMIHPNKTNTLNINLSGLTTESIEIEMEKPCAIKIKLKDLSGNPILSSHFASEADGKITLTVPYPAGNLLEALFSSSDILSDGGLPENLITNLWPVGSGYAGAYTLSNVSLDKLQFLGGYTNNGATEVVWDGKFSNPNTVKELILYFNRAPVTPAGIVSDWIENTNTLKVGSFSAVDDENDPLEAGVVGSAVLTDTLLLEEGKTTDFNGVKIFIENVGSATTPSLYLMKDSILKLHGREIVFRGKVKSQGAAHPNADGKIYLTTLWEDGRETAINGSSIDDDSAEDYMVYGKLYLTEPLFLNDSLVVEAGGYYFPNGTILPDDTSKLIPFTKENYVE